MTSRIRRARKLAGLTMGQASRLLSIPIVDLSNLELERSIPTLFQMKQLSDCYGCSLEWINGAETKIPDQTKQILRAADITADERESLLEIIGSLSTTVTRDQE